MGISIKERLSYCLSEDISVAKAALYGLLRIAFKCEKITFKELVAKWCERVDTDRECAEDNLRYFAEQFDAVLKVRKEELSMDKVCEAIISGWPGMNAKTGLHKVILSYEERCLKIFYFRLALMLYINLPEGDDKQKFSEWLMNLSACSLNVVLLNDLLSFSPEAPELLFLAKNLLKYRLDNPNFDEVTENALKCKCQNITKWGTEYLACLRNEAKLAKEFRTDIWFAYLRIAKAYGSSDDKNVRTLSVTAYWKAKRYLSDKKPYFDKYSVEKFVAKTAELYDVSLAADTAVALFPDYPFAVNLRMVDCVLHYIVTPIYQTESILALWQELAKYANVAPNVVEVGKRYDSLLAKAFDGAEGGELVKKVQDMCSPEQEKIMLAVISFWLEKAPEQTKYRWVEFAALALEVVKRYRSEITTRKAKELLTAILKADWANVTTNVPVEVLCKAMTVKTRIKVWANLVELLMEHLLLENIYKTEDLYAACGCDGKQIVDLRACLRKSLTEVAKMRIDAKDAESQRRNLISQLRNLD